MAKNIDPYLLIVTMEECGELVQACSKVYRHGNKKQDRKLLSEEGLTLAEYEEMMQSYYQLINNMNNPAYIQNPNYKPEDK